MGRKKRSHPVTEYAEQVTGSKIPAGELHILACERHLHDLKTGKMRGIYFDNDAADRALEFFSYLRFWEGEWAGRQFELQPWQAFIVGSIFGWKRADETRRFRTAYIEIPRKNGKTPLIAGIGLYLFVADDEPGAQVFSAATKRDQAKIVWNHAAKMVRQSPALAKRIETFWGKSNMSISKTSSKFEPLGADADTTDGLNIHGGLIDEFHAHKTRAMFDVIDTSLGSRRQPLISVITTAGFNQNSVCYEMHDYVEKILKRIIDDDTYFAFIASADKNDDWKSISTWKKANPNFGISVKEGDLKRLCNKAEHLPTAVNNFLTKRLNIWTQQYDRWISLNLWDKNAGIVSEEGLAGRICYGGLDLSSVSDITAWVMVFPHDDDPEMIDVLCRFWCPEAQLKNTQNRYRDQYRSWVKQGYLNITPGDAVDYSFIKAQILQDALKFKLIDLNIDRLFQAHQIGMELQEEGLIVVGMGQGFTSMAVPMKEFERRLLARKLKHGGNPILRFMADSVVVKKDAAGNLKPDKASSQARIDGIVGLVMALDRAMRREDKKSVYEKRGMRSL